MRFTVHDFQVQDAKRHFFFTGAAAGIIGALGSMAGSGMFSGKILTVLIKICSTM